MTHPKLPLTGACLCGAVDITVTTAPLLTFACHCRDCQKLSAGAYTMTTMVPIEGFSCSGELIRGGVGTTDRSHFFCKKCLNNIYSRVDGAAHRVNLRTALLDQAAAFAPFVELMTDEKLPWAEVSAQHRYARFPASPQELEALFDAYALR